MTRLDLEPKTASYASSCLAAGVKFSPTRGTSSSGMRCVICSADGEDLRSRRLPAAKPAARSSAGWIYPTEAAGKPGERRQYVGERSDEVPASAVAAAPAAPAPADVVAPADAVALPPAARRA
eukprot:CAMPEP_0181366114 /NCGR_PEP_ID=MMETSP1106-20121128/10492_1 /TAXON_ID=81844 /ORGANISM="Mantoniella antarctica, Strain SL-175" /LENGTH=122 /DNA_ID=CAMNT_0023481363 /DNA_START=735 /DNA_END=1100 /DNA_ORIENTATION=+